MEEVLHRQSTSRTHKALIKSQIRPYLRGHWATQLQCSTHSSRIQRTAYSEFGVTCVVCACGLWEIVSCAAGGFLWLRVGVGRVLCRINYLSVRALCFCISDLRRMARSCSRMGGRFLHWLVYLVIQRSVFFYGGILIPN
ncbi:hypothetical protein EJ06DRAFT_266291 [Trichodelitschia bisporula]|uniref:Uncharacterized protein n=1 Tax=Trichodelitschia bisporula TaxID=703511 RepID=A0A6G1HIP9_9PEZI|nr:hypothetical protein EJ06DRAFT_266291 [Trichodelitschia bisporula]